MIEPEFLLSVLPKHHLDCFFKLPAKGVPFPLPWTPVAVVHSIDVVPLSRILALEGALVVLIPKLTYCPDVLKILACEYAECYKKLTSGCRRFLKLSMKLLASLSLWMVLDEKNSLTDSEGVAASLTG